MGQVGERARAPQVFVHLESHGAALHGAARGYLHVVTHDLQVAAIAGQQAPQEREVALVQLHLRTDRIREPVDLWSQGAGAGHVLGQLLDREGRMRLRTPRQPRALKGIFRVHHELRRFFAVLPLDARDQPTENFLRVQFPAGVNDDCGT